MKTDYEFIKDKFDESVIKAPESMNEEFVLEKIKDTKPRRSKKPFIITGLSAAAAVAIFTVSALIVTTIVGNTPRPITVLQSDTAKLSGFKSTDDVKKALREIYKDRKSYQNDVIAEDGALLKNELSAAISDNAAGDAAPKSAESGHNSTYTQYTDVDEADTVKTDGRYIYYLTDSSKISVFSAEGKASKEVAQIKPKSNNRTFNDFYINGDKLVATVSYSAKNEKNNKNYYFYYNPDTAVEIYDISDIKNIKLKDSFTQSGSYCSSRMIGSMLYVVSNHTANDENDLPKSGKKRSATDDEATPDEIPCGCVYTVEHPTTPNFLVVSSIDTSNGAQATKTKAILGSADTVYCNTEHLFVTAAQYDYEHNYGEYFYGMTGSKTQIVKVDLNKELEFTATAKVDGYIDNQYSLDEKDGYLRIATTSVNKSHVEINNLFILDRKLNKTGKVTGFAKNESIKAVRYIGDTAYVITYEQTDPLFVIDTSDVKNPKILGEVKISGFSTMLVPVNDNTLLGIGYYTQDEDYIDMEVQEGIKLALFDVSDKADPKVLDEKAFKGYGSQVQFNPKALLVNSERGDYTIPYNHYTENGDYLNDYGVINFKVDGKKIKIVDEYKSDKFSGSDEDSSTLERCVYTDNYIYMLGTQYNYNKDYENDYSSSANAVIDAVQYK